MTFPMTKVTPAMIQAFLAQHQGSTAREVAAALGCGFRTAKREMEAMCKRGELSVTPNGAYADSLLYWPSEISIEQLETPFEDEL